MQSAAHSPTTNFAQLWLQSAIASIFLAACGGCCGGRLVSVQLYEPPLHAACRPCGDHDGVGLPGLFHGRHAARLGDDQAGFRSPALVPPHPRFHPVPTQPVFEPRAQAVPLRVLESHPPLPDASSPSGEPTPAKPPVGDDRAA